METSGRGDSSIPTRHGKLRSRSVFVAFRRPPRDVVNGRGITWMAPPYVFIAGIVGRLPLVARANVQAASAQCVRSFSSALSKPSILASSRLSSVSGAQVGHGGSGIVGRLGRSAHLGEAGSSVNALFASPLASQQVRSISTKRRRSKKMNKHKYEKMKKRMRNLTAKNVRN